MHKSDFLKKNIYSCKHDKAYCDQALKPQDKIRHICRRIQIRASRVKQRSKHTQLHTQKQKKTKGNMARSILFRRPIRKPLEENLCFTDCDPTNI